MLNVFKYIFNATKFYSTPLGAKQKSWVDSAAMQIPYTSLLSVIGVHFMKEKIDIKSIT